MDRADRWFSTRRGLVRALAHPWQSSALFGLAFLTGGFLANLFDRQPVLAPLLRAAPVEAVICVFMGFSLRGGWMRRSYQRRLDRLDELAAPPPTAWYPDPSGRHEFRFWNGQRWTDFALDNGVQSADPLPPPQKWGRFRTGSSVRLHRDLRRLE